MPDLLTLNRTGFLFTETAASWNILSADFGDGYEAAATVGSPEGTREWTVRVDVLPDGADRVPALPDDLDQGPSFLLTEEVESGRRLTEEGGRRLLESGGITSTRASYLWRFFRKSKAAGNQPFWLEFDDPDDGARKLFLASFVDHRLSYTVLCAKVYSTGLQLRQRRLAGVDSPIPVSEP
jgi:hypothetical protein